MLAQLTNIYILYIHTCVIIYTHLGRVCTYTRTALHAAVASARADGAPARKKKRGKI